VRALRSSFDFGRVAFAEVSDLQTGAVDFLAREARLLEQRLYATLFEGAPAAGVVEALRGYQNEDGGFGHGLEPDKRCPASQPLDVQVALETLSAAGTSDAPMLQRACDYLAAVGSDGGVPCVLPSIAAYPRAAHWGDGDFPPGLNPTAAIVGLLYALGVDHPWLDAATGFCWRELDRELPRDAHGLVVTFGFLEHVPDRRRAEALAEPVAAQLPDAELFLADADAEGYGLTPLAFAPTPDSRWRQLFDDAQIEAHLDRLERDQQADGGWPVSWEPPSEASRLEWRGIVTLGALRTLSAYGRLS
jgi:hypothetical protein